jgi:hypothetical protein
VVNKFLEIVEIAHIGAIGARKNQTSIFSNQEIRVMNERRALEAGHESAIKLKNAKAAPHSVVASAREHMDDRDNDADGDDIDGSGANSPWVRSILLERITRGLHESVIIFRTNPICGPLSLFPRSNRELRLSSSLKQAQRVSKEAFTAITCTD